MPAIARQTSGRPGGIGGVEPVAAVASGEEVGERPLVADPAELDDREPVAQLLDLAHQVGREQDRDPVGRQPPDQVAHVAHAGRVEAGRGLVEEQEARPAQERPGEPEALAHPVRVAADAVAGAVVQVDQPQELVDAARRRRRRASPASRGSAAPTGTGRTPAPRRTRRPRPAPRPGRRSGPVRRAARTPPVGRMSPSIIRSDVVLPGAVRPQVAEHVARAHRQSVTSSTATSSP